MTVPALLLDALSAKVRYSIIASCEYKPHHTHINLYRYVPQGTHRKERKYKTRYGQRYCMLRVKQSVHSFLERFSLICSVCPSYRRKQVIP